MMSDVKASGMVSTSAHAREQFGRLRVYVERMSDLKREKNYVEQQIWDIAKDVLECGQTASKLHESQFIRVCDEQFDFVEARRFIGANVDKPERIMRLPRPQE